MYSNKKIGNDTENEFADMMYKKGWWVHIFADKVNGQPCDIVMIKDKVTWMLDVKHVAVNKQYFLHSRIEENQRNVFNMLSVRNFHNTGFAIKFDDGWYLLKYSNINQESKRTFKKDMTKID